MTHAKGLTALGLFGLLATAMSTAAAAPVGAGTAAVQRAAPSDVVLVQELVQDRAQRPRRVRAQRSVAQPITIAEAPILAAPAFSATVVGAVIPAEAVDYYPLGDACRFIYPCNMSNTLD
jgi:hypothetical protein